MKSKKIVCILYSIVLIGINVFGFAIFSNYRMTDKIFHKRVVEVQSRQQELVNVSEVHKELLKFANQYHITIMKYEFLNEKELSIYTTNQQEVLNMKFPYTTWKINVYSFKDLKNVGYGNTFYIDHTTREIEQKLEHGLSQYGIVKIYTNQQKWQSINNLSMLYLHGFSVLFLLLGFSAYYIYSRKKIALMKYWGYSKTSIIWEINKDIIRFWIFNEIIWLMIWIGTGWKFEGIQKIKEYMFTYILINLLTNIIIFLLAIIINCMILSFEKHISEGKKNVFFSQIKKVSYIVLTSVFIAVQLTLSNATNDAQRLKDKQHTLSYWNMTKNIYTINFQGYDSSVVEDSLEARNINDELEKFYQKSKDKLKIFLINSDNYAKESDGRGNQRYEFEYAGDKEEQIYSPAGRSIQIDENYLKRNPIQTCNGKVISKLIDYDQNTLNVLVPEQYKKYEKKIIKNYKENFYFQKVTIDNYFRKNMNKPKNMLKKDKLSINIIYVKSNQSYFTYDSDTGNDKNLIIDPIAVIYTGGVDSSCIAAMYAGDIVSGSIYFEDDSKKQGQAYRKVEVLEQKLGIYQFNSVTNIYGQAASNLVIIRQKVMWQSAILLAVILCSIVFITIAVSGYYFSKQQRLLLEALWGYGYMSSIKEIILVLIGINLCTTAVVYIIKHNVVVWYFMIIACIIEIIVTKLEYDYLSKKNLHEKIINGEQW